jgi:hypothetical protein
MRLRVATMILVLVGVHEVANAEILEVTTKGNLCSFAIYGVPISSAVLTGDRADIVLLLDHYASFYIHSCPYILSSDYGKKSEAEYFIDLHGKPATINGDVRHLSSRHVFVEITSNAEFVTLTEKALIHTKGASAGGIPPSGVNTGGPPSGAAPPGSPGPPSESKSQNKGSCEVEGEICIDSNDKVELTASCGPIGVTFSTKGDVSLKIKSDKGEVSVPLPGR